ncbi:hypothetical protein DW091_13095 [Eubacterium sp. AM05-23]|nr:hypothetical protein DW091_13095 [Eubacterium sp. AM05-23]
MKVDSGKFRCKSAAGRFDVMRPMAALLIALASAKGVMNLPSSTFHLKQFSALTLKQAFGF